MSNHKYSLIQVQCRDFTAYSFSIFEESDYVASWNFHLNADGMFLPSKLEAYLKGERITLADAFEHLKDHRGIETYIKVGIARVVKNVLLVAREPNHDVRYYRFPVDAAERKMLTDA